MLYCYELQVAATAQRRGLGKFLMVLLELIARREAMTHVVLTVFKVNAAALALYTSMRWGQAGALCTCAPHPRPCLCLCLPMSLRWLGLGLGAAWTDRRRAPPGTRRVMMMRKAATAMVLVACILLLLTTAMPHLT